MCERFKHLLILIRLLAFMNMKQLIYIDFLYDCLNKVYDGILFNIAGAIRH